VIGDALVCDADLGQALLHARLLQDLGLDAIVARDGKEALERIDACPPALLVTELSLPYADGFAVLRALRARASADRSPALVVSAFRTLRDDAALLAGQLGISAVLSKAASTAELRDAFTQVWAGRPVRVLAAAPDDEIERRRVAAVEKQELLEDDPFDARLEALVRRTAQELAVPVAYLSVMLADRQWFKAHVGMPASIAQVPTPRPLSFCTHVVDARAALVVPDARAHPAFVKHPLVVRGLVRSYAGAPLIAPSGDVLGTLCILSPELLALGTDKVEALESLAQVAAGELEVRAQLRRQRERPHAPLAHLESVLDGLDSGVLLMGADGRVAYLNQAVLRFTGLPYETIAASNHAEWISLSAKLHAHPDELLRRTRGLGPGPFCLCLEYEAKLPVRRWFRWVARPVVLPEPEASEASGATIVGQLNVFTDITAEKDLAIERERLARTDALTGLVNRRGGEWAIAREVARRQRGDRPLAFALVDIDQFKRINDEQGHAIGDQILVDLARVLEAHVRGSDLAIRWGGEEFLLVLPETDAEQARAAAERVRAAVEALDRQVTVSVGVCAMAANETSNRAISRADAALYEAKRAGRNRVELA
jgi:diguanylate cyclase (GGDEF)-like protein